MKYLLFATVIFPLSACAAEPKTVPPAVTLTQAEAQQLLATERAAYANPEALDRAISWLHMKIEQSNTAQPKAPGAH